MPSNYFFVEGDKFHYKALACNINRGLELYYLIIIYLHSPSPRARAKRNAGLWSQKWQTLPRSLALMNMPN